MSPEAIGTPVTAETPAVTAGPARAQRRPAGPRFLLDGGSGTKRPPGPPADGKKEAQRPADAERTEAVLPAAAWGMLPQDAAAPAPRADGPAGGAPAGQPAAPQPPHDAGAAWAAADRPRAAPEARLAGGADRGFGAGLLDPGACPGDRPVAQPGPHAPGPRPAGGGHPESRGPETGSSAGDMAPAAPGIGKSPPFRLEPLRSAGAPAGQMPVASAADWPGSGGAREASLRPVAGSKAAAAPAAEGLPPADVRLVTTRAELLSVTLAAATPAVRDRLAGASGELRDALARIGTEVEAIHVELRGGEPSGLPPSAPSGADMAGGQPAEQSRSESWGEGMQLIQTPEPAERFLLEASLQGEATAVAVAEGPEAPDTPDAADATETAKDASSAGSPHGGARNPGGGRQPLATPGIDAGAGFARGARHLSPRPEAAGPAQGRIDRYA